MEDQEDITVCLGNNQLYILHLFFYAYILIIYYTTRGRDLKVESKNLLTLSGAQLFPYTFNREAG